MESVSLDSDESSHRRGTLDFRLVVQKLRREFTHAQDFLFKIAAQSARMREFSSRFLDNQPEI